MTSRELALAVVRDVFEPARDGRTRGAHEAFDYRAKRSGLDARDRAFAAELAYGSIKFRRFLDWLLSPYVGARAATLPPTILDILRLGAYQLAKMSVQPHAAVGETVGLAKRYGHRGTAGLVNAVLRRLTERAPPDRIPKRADFRTDDDFLGVLHSFPTWIVALARRSFGDDLVEPMLAGMNLPAQAALRVNLLRATPQDAAAALLARGIPTATSSLAYEVLVPLDVPAGESLDDPELRWETQGEVAAVPVATLDPKPGERGIDLCSGRGNKTLQIIARMEDRGTLTSVDDDGGRLSRQRARLEQLGIESVTVLQGDATALEGADDADFVLLDAPCSGLGILGRQPEARWRKDPGDPERLAALQGALLDAGAKRVRLGGRLVYSVCSFTAAESDDRIAAFLQQHADFEAVEVRRFPPGIDRRDGFFIARLERRRS